MGAGDHPWARRHGRGGRPACPALPAARALRRAPPNAFAGGRLALEPSPPRTRISHAVQAVAPVAFGALDTAVGLCGTGRAREAAAAALPGRTGGRAGAIADRGDACARGRSGPEGRSPVRSAPAATGLRGTSPGSSAWGRCRRLRGAASPPRSPRPWPAMRWTPGSAPCSCPRRTTRVAPASMSGSGSGASPPRAIAEPPRASGNWLRPRNVTQRPTAAPIRQGRRGSPVPLPARSISV